MKVQFICLTFFLLCSSLVPNVAGYRTPLKLAVMSNDTAMAKELLTACPSEQYLLKSQALYAASFLGREQIAEELLSYNSNSTHVMAKMDQPPRTPLIAASMNGHERVVELLWKAHPTEQHLLAVDESGYTALILASALNKIQVVNRLLLCNHNASHLLARSHFGNTALMMASFLGDKEVVEALLKRNSAREHLLARNSRDETALMKAYEMGHSQVAVVLLKHFPEEQLQVNDIIELLAQQDLEPSHAPQDQGAGELGC